MRIKLRLYTRDLDLIALKQNPNFKFTSAIRQALVDYVTVGECRKIYVPTAPSEDVILQNEQIDISLSEETHQKVIDWILGLRQGMRSSAIKAVFRSAIVNPSITPYQEGSPLIIPEPVAAPEEPPTLPTESKENTQPESNPVKEKMTENETGEKELDLFDDAFFDVY